MSADNLTVPPSIQCKRCEDRMPVLSSQVSCVYVCISCEELALVNHEANFVQWYTPDGRYYDTKLAPYLPSGP